jgi:hypothetical protein
MELYKSYKIYIRSKDVLSIDSEFNSAMTINLKAGLNLHSGEKFRLKLDTCEIPHTFYNVSKNVFNDQIFLDGSFVQLIPEGNYSVYDMIDYLTGISTFPYSCTYDEISAKFTLTNTDSTLHVINFTDGLAKLLGFKFEDRTINAGSSLTSFNTVNFQSIHSLFVHSSLSSSNVISTINNSYENIVGKIPVNRVAYQILSYDPSYSKFDILLDNKNISTFDISIKDQNNNLVQFNGVNFEISLLLEIYRQVVIPVIETRRADTVPSPIISQPVPEPVVLEPVITPIVAQPVITQPVITQPVITQPVITQPAIIKSEPINIPQANHDLEDAIFSAKLLDLEGLL